MADSKEYVRVPLFPIYEEARYLYQALDNVSRKLFTGLISTIYSLTGTPQENEDWTDPDNWIPERLQGLERELASHIWLTSNKIRIM